MSLSTAEWNSLRLKPGFCLIEPMEPPHSVGAIILPDTAREYCFRSPVGKVSATSGEAELGFAVGDWVIYARTAAAELETADRGELDYVRISDVMAVIRG